MFSSKAVSPNTYDFWTSCNNQYKSVGNIKNTNNIIKSHASIQHESSHNK